MNWKKIILALAFLVVLGIGSYLVYLFFFKPLAPLAPVPSINAPLATLPSAPGLPKTEIKPVVLPGTEITPPTPPTPPETPAGVSSVALGGLTQVSPLSPTAVEGASLSSDGKNLIYYNKTDGKFYNLSSDGQAKTLSDKNFYQVKNIAWAPNKEKAVLEYPDGSNILFNFKTNQQISLPNHWQEFNFSPDSSQISGKSIGLDISNRWLVISNDDGSGARPIEALGNNADKVRVSWSPNDQIIAFSRTGEEQGFDRQEILLIGKNQENFKSLTVEGWDFMPQWSPKGDRLIYSAYNSKSSYKPSLWIVDAQGDNIGSNRKSLQINTWADKCVFGDNNSLYCAVPDSLSEGAGFMPQLSKNVPDTFYKIDLNTGLKSIIADPYGDYTAEQVMLSKDNQYLYFTNVADKKIYKMQLK